MTAAQRRPAVRLARRLIGGAADGHRFIAHAQEEDSAEENRVSPTPLQVAERGPVEDKDPEVCSITSPGAPLAAATALSLAQPAVSCPPRERETLSSAADLSVNQKIQGATASPYRVLLVDDRPDVRLLLRMRLNFEPDIEVVGEASNGAEAIKMTRALTPSAVVLDMEMPVMRGDEAIPLMRTAVPGMGIMLYTWAEHWQLAEEAAPDAFVLKGVPLDEVVTILRSILTQMPFDILRLELGSVPLHQAITAFDTWAGLNVRVLEAIDRGEELVGDQLSGATSAELEALMSVYAHIGNNLQKAAHAGDDRVSPVIHVFRSTGVLARRALLAFNNHRLPGFWQAWGYDVPGEAVTALSLMRDRLMEVLPASTGSDDPADSEQVDAFVT